MKIGEIVLDSLRYPFTDVKKLITLFIILLGSFLLIPGLYALGYGIKIIKNTINGSNVLPDFKGSGEILGDGLRFLGASIIYGIPIYLITIVILLISLTPFTANTLSTPLARIILLIVGFIVSIPFFIGLANMAYQDRFKAAFDFKIIFKLITKIGWKNYLVYLVIYTIVSNLLGLIPSLVISPSSTIVGIGTFIKLGESFIIIFVIYTYILTFGGRLRGLIYPIGIVEPGTKREPVSKGNVGSVPSSADINRRLKEKRERKSCPNCNTTMTKDMGFCPECGENLKKD